MVKKTVENAASDRFGWNFSRTLCSMTTKFYVLIVDNQLQKFAGYDITNWFRSASKSPPTNGVGRNAALLANSIAYLDPIFEAKDQNPRMT